MIAAIFRLIALRPFLGMAILGIPILLLIAVGLVTILAFKFIVFIVLPIVAVVWLVRRCTRSSSCEPDVGHDTGPDIAQ
jgi:membrane protein implicated in regulation of membrane protease activity